MDELARGERRHSRRVTLTIDPHTLQPPEYRKKMVNQGESKVMYVHKEGGEK